MGNILTWNFSAFVDIVSLYNVCFTCSPEIPFFASLFEYLYPSAS